MRTASIRIEAPESRLDGYRLTLEVAEDGEVVTETLPQPHVAAKRPIDDKGQVLDVDAIHELLLREAPLPSIGELQRIGDYLGGLLSYGAIGERWDELRALYPREDPPTTEGLFVLLEVTPAALRALPWELARRHDLWAFVDPRNPFARMSEHFNPDPPEESEWWPLRLTVVIGSEPDDDVVKADEELDNLDEALAKVAPDVHYDEIKRPDEAELARKLNKLRPHVLHFIGHGESKEGESGKLLVWDEAGNRAWDWSAEDIATSVQIIPRIAVLNACRSGDEQPQDGTWQVADAFMRLGTHAVLAMQGDIDGRAGAAFSAGLYEALLREEEIHVAVAQGRQRVLTELGKVGRDFCLPTLTLARPPGRVLPPRIGIPSDKLGIVELLLPQFPFVDRQPQRRQILDYLDPRDTDRVALLTLITGEADVGKTSLVKWALRQLAYRGREVTYVDLGVPEEQRRSAVDVLRAIRDAVHGTRAPDARGFLPFDRWTHALNHLVAGEVPASEPTQPVVDGNEQFHADAADLERIFQIFLEVLAAIPDKPLLLALDQLDAVASQDFDSDVFPKLIRPLLVNQDAGVSLVLAGRGMTHLPSGIEPGCRVTLQAFEPAQAPILVRQYLRYHDEWKTVIDQVLGDQDKPWTPVNLEKWRDVARGLK